MGESLGRQDDPDVCGYEDDDFQEDEEAADGLDEWLAAFHPFAKGKTVLNEELREYWGEVRSLRSLLDDCHAAGAWPDGDNGDNGKLLRVARMLESALLLSIPDVDAARARTAAVHAAMDEWPYIRRDDWEGPGAQLAEETVRIYSVT